jgi:4-hydroxy-tetrahydrodipicolinate reductase
MGRMGARLIQLILEDPTLRLGAALERAGHPQLGNDAGSLVGARALGIALAESLAPDAAIDVMIDFSAPAASLALAATCQERAIPLVVGTTGFDSAERRRLESAATRTPILISPNMSRAVNLLMKLVGDAARVLGGTSDIEIIERHHRTKKDAPSGTALRLADFAGRGAAARLIGAQAGKADVRAPGEIGIHALRIADSPGEHTVVFGLPGETLELSHRALNRDGFARGALDAARFLAGRPPGLYSMDDVLG